MAGPVERLIERDAPLKQIDARLVAALAGEGGLVAVEGPAGIGKSRVLAGAAARARARGLTVLRARGGELEHDVTFGVARQLFERELHDRSAAERDRLTGGSARLAVAALGAEAPPEGFSPETGPLHGLYWLTVNLAQERPLALLIDDAHWADEESLRFLLYLVRRLDGLGVVVLVAARTPGSGLLDAVVAEASGQHIALAPLSPAGAGAVLHSTLGRAVPPPVVAAAHEVTGGNPFFLQEMAGALALEDAPDAAQLEGRVRALVPPAVRHAVGLRLRGEGAGAEAVGLALATLGGSPPLDVIAQVAGRPEPEASAALARLAAAGLASEDGLVHPIMRTAIYGAAPVSQRRRLHRLAAEALRQRGAPSDQVAQHLLLTDPARDPEVARALADAGHAALRRGAAQTAVRLLERALAEQPGVDPEPDTLLALAAAELSAGSLDAAIDRLHALTAGEIAPATRTRAVLMLSRATAERDGEPAAIAELRAAFSQLEGDDALRVDVEQASLAMYVAQQIAAVRARLVGYAELPGRTPAERVALAVTSFAHAIDPAARAADVGPLAVRALGDGRLLAEETTDSLVLQDPLHALQLCEWLDEHDVAVQQAFADARARGSALGFVMLSLAALTSAVLRGETGLAVGHGEAALRVLPDVPARLVVRFWASSVRRFATEALVARGELGRASALLEGADDAATREHGRYAQGLLAAAEGTPDVALAHFVAYGAFCAAAGWESRDTPWRLQAALALRTLGRRTEARALADEALEEAEGWGAPGWLGQAQRVAALVGPGERTLAGLVDAVGTLRGSLMGLALAEALVDLGVARRRDGQRAPAREALVEGLVRARRCEAEPLVQRAEAELAVLGGAPGGLRVTVADPTPAAEPPAAGADGRAPGAVAALLERQGEIWRVKFAGDPFFVRDAKGIGYLARLLALPDVELPALQLAAPGNPAAGPAPPETPGLAGGLGPLLDPAAKAAFRDRLLELEADLDQARDFRDPERVVALERERAALAQQLAAAVGLGGRDRPQGSDAERARINVTRALRAAISRLAEKDAALGRHLEVTIRTGAFCVHRAELGDATWTVRG